MTEHPRDLLEQLRAEACKKVQAAEFPELASTVGMLPDRFNRFLVHTPKAVFHGRRLPSWFNV